LDLTNELTVGEFVGELEGEVDETGHCNRKASQAPTIPLDKFQVLVDGNGLKLSED
jgi:hypothetical protein